MKDALIHLCKAMTLAVVLALVGCATTTPNFTTQEEVLSKRGEPVARWANDDGSTTLEYSTQPDGTTCLMVQVDAEGKVLRQWDALTPQNLARVKLGMSKEEVSRILGAHRSERVLSDSKEEVWDWSVRFRRRKGLFNVYFADDKVKSTERAVLYAAGEDDRAWYPYYYYPFVPFLWFGPTFYWGGGHHWHGGHWHGGMGFGGGFHVRPR
ncbi:MAG: hypothetical protein LBR05_03305 [Azoarcus sp.]|jgi:outer membrane protein assembly factor BamE (lipoprotein component of BamABCDE complex)|nr:hypothetical protein [Azoarcus sp.]